MDKEKTQMYSEQYKKVQRRLSLGLTIFILLLGLVFIGIGLFLCLYKFNQIRVIIGSIMVVAGSLDIWLSIRFYFFSKNNLKNMPPQEAARRYSRITGKK